MEVSTGSHLAYYLGHVACQNVSTHTQAAAFEVLLTTLGCFWVFLGAEALVMTPSKSTLFFSSPYPMRNH